MNGRQVAHEAPTEAGALTVTEAAEELNLPRTTASSRLTAALKLLNEWLDEILSLSERLA